MKNKSLIIICCMLFFVVLIIILNSTIFSVNSVKLNFLSSKINITESNEEILENSKLNIGGSIFFVNKNEIKRKIQATYPYIRVINIESKFPNKIEINVIEKEQFYAVKLNNGFAICDEWLGVICFEEGFTSTNQNPIILEGLTLNSSATLGQDLDTQMLDYIKTLSYTLREWELNTNVLLGNIDNITLNFSKENQLMISMFSGTTILIENSNINLSDKLNYVFSYYDQNQIASKGGLIKVIDCDDGYSRIIYSN